jgi:hypothetical protein
VVVLSAKFVEGAWVTVLLIPVMLFIMRWVRRHYDNVTVEVKSEEPADFTDLADPIVIIPIAAWNRITKHALRFAYTVSNEVRAVHIDAGEETENAFCISWPGFAEEPAIKAGLPPPELVVLESPYRRVLTPILDYVLEVEKQNPHRQVAVVLPEMVERRWYHYFLHNQRAQVLKTWLMVRGNARIIAVNVPWYLKS